MQVSPENIEQNRRSLSFGNEAAVFDFLKQGISQANPYLLGEEFSAVDLYAAYCLIFAISAKILPPFDEFRPYLQQMASRDSLKDMPWFQDYRV